MFASIKLYALAAVGLAITALVVAFLWQRGQLIQAEAERDAANERVRIAAETNAQQQRSIEAITALRAHDDQILADVTSTMARLADESSAVLTSVNNLERANDEVKKYLAIRVPPDLAKLLNETRAGPVRKNGDAPVKSPRSLVRALSSP